MNNFLITLLVLCLLTSGCSGEITEQKPQETITNVTSSETHTIIGVDVFTDKTEYRQGETINITLKNNLDESIFSHFGNNDSVFSIECIERKTPDGIWEKLFVWDHSVVYDMGPPVEIRPDESGTYLWKPLIYTNDHSDEVQAGPGTYKLKVYYQIRKGSSSKDWKWLTAYSNEFIIK